MALEPGAQLGVYQVLSAIGAGGMDEVYKARDTKLDRDVALKILPDAFVNDTERLEARPRKSELFNSLQGRSSLEVRLIVNMASAAGLLSNPKMSVYCASKWAVNGWSDSLRLELEEKGYDNICVTTVTPGYVNTGMFEGVKAPLMTPILEPEPFVQKSGDP